MAEATAAEAPPPSAPAIRPPTLTAAQAYGNWKPKYNPWIVALTVTLATFMEVLDTSIANVALPHIAGGLAATPDEATWVLTSYLVSNAVVGVTTGWTKELDIVGIGYRAELKGKNTVVFTLGFSHQIEFPLPTGIEVAVDPKQTHLTISGIDRQKVGQVAADMRSLRKPDPYKNKGVRYTGERLKKKVGKTGAK